MSEKAFAYMRVSGKGQIQGDGFPRQKAAIEQYAKAHSYEIAAEFRDEGVSGTKELENRDGLSDLMVALKSNGVRTVLIENADRLARDLLVSEILLAEFRKIGVKVLTSHDDDLTVSDDNPTRKLIRQVLGAVAEFEKSSLVIKLRAARQRKKRDTGRCEGRKRFGEMQGELETIKRMTELYRKRRGEDRMSLRGIAKQLNQEGMQTRSGQPWTDVQIKRVLVRSGVKLRIKRKRHSEPAS